MRYTGSVLIVVAALQAVEWLVAYHRTTGGAWRRTQMGRHLMAFMASIAAVLAVWSTAVVLDALGFDLPTWFDVLRLAVFVSIPIVLAWRRVLLAGAQRFEG